MWPWRHEDSERVTVPGQNFMWEGFPLIPEQASTIAPGVDLLYYFLSAVSIFFSLLIFSAIFYFAIRYRRRSDTEIPKPIHGSTALEIFWSAVPFCIVMVMFGWGASLYFTNSRAPEGAMTINVVGKQWMWKLQHPEGQREINELHVPAGRPVKITISSEDVLHSLYFPSFRTKMDAIPGRYTYLWFEAQKPGVYRIFCTEYCGTNHSGMIGSVTVLEPAAFQAWLQGGAEGGTLAQRGARLFDSLACNSCHLESGRGRGPSLKDIVGTTETLQDGSTVVVDDAYLRESILTSQAKIVRGFQPLMPTFQGLISEENLVALIEHVKSLSPKATTAAAAPPAETKK
jgi:cytochrome c oxidase subunit 2